MPLRESQKVALHEVKCWPEPFQAVWLGVKTYEVRVNDRDYRVGDSLWLREYLPNDQAYTGRERVMRITYMTHGPAFGLPADMVVMAIV